MQKILFIAGALVIAATLTGKASAEQYKWTDRNGKVEYGDVPPAGVNATRLKPSASSQPAPATAKSDSKAAAKDASDARKGPLTPAEQEAEFRKRQLEAEKARAKSEKTAQEAESKRDNCKYAQDYLRQLEGGQRIARTNASGERYFMEDEQRAAEIAKARKVAGDSCS